jgi:hypothetical protein
MAKQPARTRALEVSDRPPDNPAEELAARTIDLTDDHPNPFEIHSSGAVKIENADNSVTILLDELGPPSPDMPDDLDFNANLAEYLSEPRRSEIAGQIIEGIEQDEQTRRDWIEMRARGLGLLGLKLEEPRGDAGTSSAPLEGQSTVRHPILLEAVVAFQAGAMAELLPAAGPVKVRSDSPSGAPSSPPGQPPLGEGEEPQDELAAALETDFNHYLTVTAREYVPDTDRMFFGIAMSGDGFKKGFHCPLRRRPVLESIPAEDLIVSNAATDLQNCPRVTHRIMMKRSTLRRMQIVGAYLDVKIAREPMPQPADELERKKAEITGQNRERMLPKDSDYMIYESYVEIDLDEFAPEQFKGDSLPLPYKVSIEKESRKLLELRRNWRPDDDLCRARETFVQFPFIRGLGFYGLGFVHLLGNATMALTAAWREMLDAGMFANFPGFLYAKQVGRQLTNQFRCPPGGGLPLDLPAGQSIQQVVMPFPYKEIGPAFPAFVKQIEDNARQTAMIANSPVAEGNADAPVGTTLALIEQASKVVASAFKRLHTAQAQEFQMLKELFLEDPEAMWRHNKKPAVQWKKDQFLAALQSAEVVPVADPNNPTSLHRAMKAAMLKTMQQQAPTIYDPVAVDRRIMNIVGIDPEGLLKPPQPQGQGADPAQAMIAARMQLEQQKVQLQQKQLQLKAAESAAQQQGKAADRASRERIEVLRQQVIQEQNQQEQLADRMKMVEAAIDHLHQLSGGNQQQQPPQRNGGMQ